jgi:hypothetical protein
MTDESQADAGVPGDPTLAERAATAALAELRGERAGILGAIGPTALAPLTRTRTVPERWSFLFVMERMEEAFRTLSRLAVPTRPKGYINSMPIYLAKIKVKAATPLTPAANARLDRIPTEGGNPAVPR